MKRIRIIHFWAFLFLAVNGFPAEPENALIKRDIQVGSLQREFLLHVPSKIEKQGAPVVFVFHGHGATALKASRFFRIHEVWPEALIVYLQGVNTPGRLSDPEGKLPGWQHNVGDFGDRDLHFFDAALNDLKKRYQINEKAIFAMGHSNGGLFSYLLWGQRGKSLRAIATVGSAFLDFPAETEPIPVLHIAGKNDHLATTEWKDKTLAKVRTINRCKPTGIPWSPTGTVFESDKQAPLVEIVHPGGHEIPKAAPEWIAKFFKEQIALQKTSQ